MTGALSCQRGRRVRYLPSGAGVGARAGVRRPSDEMRQCTMPSEREKQTGPGTAGGSPGAFGALLRRHRRAAGLTQERLAERAPCSVRALSDLERGVTRWPQRETVRLLADALALAGPERAAFLAAGLEAAPPRPLPAPAPR